jgi:signal transduction histidine kinase
MKNKKLIFFLAIIIFIIAILVIWYLALSQKESINDNENSINNEIEGEANVLSEEEMQELIESTIPAEDASPVLSEEEMQELIESTIPAEDASPVLSEEEMQELIKATSPQE